MDRNAPRIDTDAALGAARVGVWSWDPASATEGWDSGTCTLFGEPAPPGEATWSLQNYVEPRDWRLIQERRSRAIQEGRPYYDLFRVHTADGSTRWLCACGDPYPAEAGADKRLLGIYHETDMGAWRVPVNQGAVKGFEHTWPEEQALWKSVADVIADDVLIVDEQGIICALNRHAAETEPRLHVGDSLYGYVDQYLYAEHRAILSALLEQGTRFVIELDVPTLRGGSLAYLARGWPLPDEHGQRRFLIMATDISRRVRADNARLLLERQLAHANRLSTAGEMAAGMAHELQQPLTAISQYAEGALAQLNGDAPPERLRDALRRIVQVTQRASEIVRRLRNFVAGREPRRIELDLRNTVREVLEFLARDLNEASVTLQAETPSSAVVVVGDPVQLQQVLVNLLRNALEALQQQPPSTRRIEVRLLVEENRWAVLSVSDNGSGVDPAFSGSLFTVFTTSKPQGLGLGLAICRTIANSHGGTLNLQATSAAGTTFVLRLPLVLTGGPRPPAS